MKKKYLIVNSGEEGVFAEFDFTQEEFEFLKKVFDELNTHSDLDWMPIIYIKELVMCCDCKHKGDFLLCEDGLKRGYCGNCERREEE